MKVLIADDDRATLVRLRSYLREWGHEVETAIDGVDAWRIFQQEQNFEIVISDWQMPKMDGPELIRRIRAGQGQRYVFAILLTSRSEKVDVVEGMEAGADDFISKPFDHGELRARIRAGERILALEHDLAERNAELEGANKEISRSNRRMKNDLETAAEIQKTFLPDENLETPGFQIAWRYLPCDELGGDSLSIRRLDEDHFGMYLLDVSGHGVGASLLSVSLGQTFARPAGPGCIVLEEVEKAVRAASPTDVMRQLDQRYPWDPKRKQFFTIVYAILNYKTKELKCVSAGHPGPIVLRADGSIEQLPSTPPAVGLLPDPKFTELTVNLGPGDRLFMYSDGITESMSPDRDELKEEGLARILKELQSIPLDQSMSELLLKLEQWRAHEKPADDISVLAVEMNGH